MSKTLKMLMIDLFLIALLMMTMSAQASELWLPGEEHEVEGYRVEVTDFNELAITCYLGKESDAQIPSTINGYEVREIRGGSFAFSEVQSVIIPDTIREIKGMPWSECRKLTSITVSPNNPFYESIDNAIYSKISGDLVCCPVHFGTLVIPSGVKCIADGACYGSGITDVVFPESVQYIGDYAFAHSGVRNLDLPDTIKYIGYVLLCN